MKLVNVYSIEARNAAKSQLQGKIAELEKNCRVLPTEVSDFIYQMTDYQYEGNGADDMAGKLTTDRRKLLALGTKSSLHIKSVLCRARSFSNIESTRTWTLRTGMQPPENAYNSYDEEVHLLTWFHWIELPMSSERIEWQFRLIVDCQPSHRSSCIWFFV